MQVEQYANNARTTLSAGIDGVTDTLTVADASAFPARPRFRVIVDEELLLVTAVDGATWTVARGVEGTAPAAHDSGAAVTHVLTAASLRAVGAHVVLAGQVFS